MPTNPIDTKPMLGYYSHVAPHWVARVSLLKTERIGAPTQSVFFVHPRFSMAGVIGARKSADPRFCKANPVTSATLSLRSVAAPQLGQEPHHV